MCVHSVTRRVKIGEVTAGSSADDEAAAMFDVDVDWRSTQRSFWRQGFEAAFGVGGPILVIPAGVLVHRTTRPQRQSRKERSCWKAVARAVAEFVFRRSLLR
jgi:hypothetical protein